MKNNTKQRLLESASAVFKEKGYNNATLADICECADANIAAVNYHFKSKENLYQEVFQYAYTKAEEAYPFDKGINEQVSSEKKLHMFISTLLNRMLTPKSHGDYYKLVAREMLEPTEASGTILRELSMAPQKQLVQIISEILGGSEDEERLKMLKYSIFSQCFFLVTIEKGRKHHFKAPTFTIEDIQVMADHIAKFSLAGIKCMSKDCIEEAGE